MTFGEFTIGLSVLYVVYYGIVIAIDFYNSSRLSSDKDGVEQEIDISQAVEEYHPVDMTAISSSLVNNGLKNPEDTPDEDDNESKDIEVHNMEGIMACDLKALISDNAGKPNLFEGIIFD